jgi:hypothetical protein
MGTLASYCLSIYLRLRVEKYARHYPFRESMLFPLLARGCGAVEPKEVERCLVTFRGYPPQESRNLTEPFFCSELRNHASRSCQVGLCSVSLKRTVGLSEGLASHFPA